MAVDRIKELLELMKANDLTELELKEKGFSIRLVKGSSAPAAGPATVLLSGASHAAGAPTPARAGEAAPQVAETPSGAQEVTSPIVGTFYRAASPDAEPFVEVGSHVEPDSTLCIIEAMKVMNEVRAEMSGVIRKILVENGQAVEFGQPIFLIEPVGG